MSAPKDLPDSPRTIPEAQTSSPDSAMPPPPGSSEKGGEALSSPAVPPKEDKNVVPMVGGYRLLKRLGKGALGEVWKAEAPGGVEVAVKRLSRSLEDHEAQIELRSLEHVKGLRHNYLMPIHAFWIHKGRLYVAMELADSSLHDQAEHCRKQGLPGIPHEDLLRYMREAAEALDFLHAEGVHHRDIKPANILLLKGHVKVADFGLARPLRDMDSMVNASFCGTPTYMPPEMFENKISVHSDQWSLAVSYLELRLNRRVFKGRTIPALMNEICKGRLDLAPLAQSEQRVLRRALHQDPRQRYPNCTAFVQSLEAVFHKPAPPRRWLSAVITLFACLTAGGLLVSLFYRQTGTPTQAIKIVQVRPARIYSKEIETVQVDAGLTQVFKIPVLRENWDGDVFLVAEEELPEVVHVQAKALEGNDFVTVSVSVEDRAKPIKPQLVRLKTKGEKLNVEIKFKLTILYLPRDFEAMGSETDEDDEGVKYYKRLRHKRSSVELVLIPQKAKDWQAGARLRDLTTFYISRFKISRGQFRLFAEQNPKKVNDNRWKKHSDDRSPVRDVTVTDAHAFAEWHRGGLPKREQWDKAAGRYHSARGEGPYKNKLLIAVGGRRKPLPNGCSETEDDESVYCCRDMAGNGEEWTRTTPKGEVPLENVVGALDEIVYLRGWSFKNAAPLSFKDLEREDLHPLDARTELYKETSDVIGFRVVLEPNR